MFSRYWKRFLVAFTIALSIFSIAASMRGGSSRLADGQWGGVHIAIEIHGGSAVVDYDCANGTITGPLKIDSRGRFTWKGTHKREGPGPIRLGRIPPDMPAVFSGTVKGDTMTLTVKLADSNEVISTYVLKKGSQGRVRKCR